MEHIDRATDQAASLTRQLLAFSRQQVLPAKGFHLNAVVLNTKKMLQRLIGEDVEMITIHAAGPWLRESRSWAKLSK